MERIVGFTLLIQVLGSFLPLSFCCLTWGRAGAILRLGKPVFFVVGPRDAGSVSAALGDLSCLPESQAVALRWRLLPPFRFLAARPPSGEPSPGGVLRPHPAGEAGDAHAAPPVLRVWPVEELRMARPAPAWRSPVAPGPEAWEDCWRGRWGEGAAPRRRPSPGVADPRRSQLAQRHGGRRFPEGLCGTLLPGDRRSGNRVYDVIAPADQ